MIVPIGTRRGEGGDVVAQLLECHGRIRAQLALAARLAAAPGAPDLADAAARVRRYFADALPRHVADEDEELIPRLRGRDPALDAALATMHRDHAGHDAAVARLVAACDALDLPAIAAAAAALDALLTPHLALEEATIFPAIRALPAADHAAIAAAMRARRT